MSEGKKYKFWEMIIFPKNYTLSILAEVRNQDK